MARFDPGRLSDEASAKLLRQFWQTVSLVQNDAESEVFLRDLLHPQEVVMFARRVSIAMMLREGYNFDEIALVLRTAPNTIAKINKALEFGRGGLATIADRLLDLERRDQSAAERAADRLSWEVVKRRFARFFWPAHLLERVAARWQELQRTRRKRRTDAPPARPTI